MKYAVAALLGLALLVPAFVEGKDDKTKTFEVETFESVAYVEKDGDSERHLYDMYLPKGEKNYPVLFFVHGGGWRGGSKGKYRAHGKTFAGEGVGFVAINYRLSPKIKHPEHIKDVARAFAHARADLKKRGADVGRIFLSGHSAGGHLCALLATDESYLKAHELSLKDIKGCVPVSGVFTIESKGQKMYLDAFGEDAEELKKASPMSHLAKDRPPFLLFYADREVGGLGKQAEAFVAALKKAGASAEVKMIKDRDHSTIADNAANADDEVHKAIVAFIKK